MSADVGEIEVSGETREAVQAMREALREAVLLPALFVSVAGLGGLRTPLDGGLAFLAPPLVMLVAALLFLATAARALVVDLHALVGPRRSGLEQVSGFVLLMAVFAATAQVFALVLPERGLLHGLFSFFLLLLLLLWQSFTGRREPQALVGGWAVTLLALLLFKFVALAALEDSSPGLVGRLAQALFDGVAGGGLRQPYAPATGYVAFATVVAFLAGLIALPRARTGVPPGSEGGALVTGAAAGALDQSA